MTTFTMEDLGAVLKDAAGAPETGAWNDDVLDLPFYELGYDSLALLEVSARIGRQFKIAIPDDAVVEMKTPRIAVEYINARITGA
ncbi:acyl carrier protein [Actinoplanes tereljensis]|uniref:Actinorhodin polyketide synthase acyl carrier protein n=1 Tax=Paractinoplanes tereljensis TaxID=571912 RepID=A0A919TQ07_9ACTN|nr:acyl carrier protein [Actinoplanes tereljensis]GIF17796.1 actinorhodin polyketide synthase acyl carrier protein [Actinoplanes tereljensis]